MTLIEAAASLCTSPDNLRAAIKRGSLQAVKHGRDWWVEPVEVERYRLENRRARNAVAVTLLSTDTVGAADKAPFVRESGAPGETRTHDL